MRAHPPPTPVRRAGSAALTVRARRCAVVLTASVAALAGAAGLPREATAAPPACGGTPHIVDVANDGHHANTDLIAAWFSEQAGLQVVIQPRVAIWAPDHDDSEAAGFAVLFELGGAVRYVRAEAPRGGPVRFDHGTWTEVGGFVSAGATTGVAEDGAGGAVTIDVPASIGAVRGAVLRRPFALTYDGMSGAEAHWVDRAPGGVTPAGSTFGADFVVGACTPLPPGEQPGPVLTTAVSLDRMPARLTGGRTLRFAGAVAPARAGVPVTVTLRGARAVRRTVRTGADGRWSVRLPVRERSTVQATSGGIASTTRTIEMRSRTRIEVRTLRNGGALILGRVRPALPGRVLWLRDDAVRPARTVRARDGRFRIRIARARRGRYQAVYIPLGGRAERSTSNTGVIK